ncbi:DNA-directed RNA polymerase subunit beta'-like [Pistacia vera]|uniref:DNA-directed RNA polymerase subunit beta'-like n=1 Tax=Pistacia vera TaxID=55513 RepID=UPI0012631BA5|nr:DNA-directed RNA polymerase subunit beta'-like [Pistacia vera]
MERKICGSYSSCRSTPKMKTTLVQVDIAKKEDFVKAEVINKNEAAQAVASTPAVISTPKTEESVNVKKEEPVKTLMGDQKAVHVPLTLEAQAEAYLLMFSHMNLLSPAIGDPISVPIQDMLIRLFVLTNGNHRYLCK